MRIRTARPDEAGCAAFVESSEGRGGDAMSIIDDEFLSKLVREPVVVRVSEDQEKAFAKIARLSATRDRCSHELAERLERDGFSADDAHAAIERAMACGLVDDIRYAETLIRSRLSQGKGRAGIENELAAAGIAVCVSLDGPTSIFLPTGFRKRPRVRAAVQKTSSVEERLRFRMPQTCFAGVFKRRGVCSGAALRAGERMAFLTKRGRFSCSVGVLWGKLECIAYRMFDAFR